MRVVRADTDELVMRCHGVMAELRPHVGEGIFLARVLRQAREGYRMAFVEDDGRVRAVAGFRFAENLAWGKFLYVDDLVTGEADRSKGYGEAMMRWLKERAAEADCDGLHLDSGVQRFGAHRFYLGVGMDITSHHFAMRLK